MVKGAADWSKWRGRERPDKNKQCRVFSPLWSKLIKIKEAGLQTSGLTTHRAGINKQGTLANCNLKSTKCMKPRFCRFYRPKPLDLPKPPPTPPPSAAASCLQPLPKDPPAPWCRSRGRICKGNHRFLGLVSEPALCFLA